MLLNIVMHQSYRKCAAAKNDDGYEKRPAKFGISLQFTCE